METLRCAGFVLEHDPDATRAAWAAVPRGAAEACGCAVCAAFSSARAELLSAELRELLARLGLDPERESELAWLGAGPERGSARVLAVWAFAGALREAPAEPGGLRFVADPGRAPASLHGAPCLGLELELCVPLPPSQGPQTA